MPSTTPPSAPPSSTDRLRLTPAPSLPTSAAPTPTPGFEAPSKSTPTAPDGQPPHGIPEQPVAVGGPVAGAELETARQAAMLLYVAPGVEFALTPPALTAAACILTAVDCFAFSVLRISSPVAVDLLSPAEGPAEEGPR